jgi:hypothetical protein
MNMDYVNNVSQAVVFVNLEEHVLPVLLAIIGQQMLQALLRIPEQELETV